MKRVIIILIVLFPIIGFGQSSLEKLFLNIPVELHFEELCNSLPKDTINYSINKYRKSLIKKSDYSINFHQCDGFNLTFKNINNINYSPNETDIELTKIEIEYEKDYLKSIGDSSSYKQYKCSNLIVTLKYKRKNKNNFEKDVKKMVKTLKQIKNYRLKKLNFGISTGKTFDSNNTLMEEWNTKIGYELYYKNQLFPTVQLKIKEYSSERDNFTFEIQLLYQKELTIK